jgi:hypothetical protein
VLAAEAPAEQPLAAAPTAAEPMLAAEPTAAEPVLAAEPAADALLAQPSGEQHSELRGASTAEQQTGAVEPAVAEEHSAVLRPEPAGDDTTLQLMLEASEELLVPQGTLCCVSLITRCARGFSGAVQ